MLFLNLLILGVVTYFTAYFGRGTVSIHFDYLHCTGLESRFFDCHYYFYTYEDLHAESVGIQCQAR